MAHLDKIDLDLTFKDIWCNTFEQKEKNLKFLEDLQKKIKQIGGD